MSVKMERGDEEGEGGGVGLFMKKVVGGGELM